MDYVGRIELLPLDSRGLDRVKARLSEGRSLADGLAGRILDRPGSVYAIAPAGANEEQLYSFKDGGIVPQIPRSQWTLQSNGQLAAEVVTLDAALSRAIAMRIASFGGAFFVQDWYSTPPEVNMQAAGYTLWAHGDEVYLSVAEPSVELVSNALGVGADVWPGMLAVITAAKLPVSTRPALGDAALRAVVAGTHELFIGSYDGESYLLHTADSAMAAFYEKALNESA